MRTTKQKHKARAKTEEARSAKRKVPAKTHEAIVSFATRIAADNFLEWLCGSGEQQYWDWMASVERDEDGDITAVSFDYHTPNGGKFGPRVSTRLGRVSPTSSSAPKDGNG